MKKLAVIGFGRFGQLITQLLLAHTNLEILVISSRPQSNRDRLSFGSWEDLKNVDAVIPAVPISAFEATISHLAEYISADCLCIDVCSVKSYPVKVMLEKLPKSVSILATHPMFGPDSVLRNKGLNGLSLVIYPVRIKSEVYQEIKNVIKKTGLKIQELEPLQHDKFVAYSQLYAFFMGNLTRILDLKSTPIDTFWYSLILDQSQAVTKDGPTLFEDMIMYNPYANEFVRDFKKSVGVLLSSVENIQLIGSSSKS